MERKDWRGTLRLIRRPFRRDGAHIGTTTPTEPEVSKSKRIKPWAILCALAMAILVIVGVALNTARGNLLAVSPAPFTEQSLDPQSVSTAGIMTNLSVAVPVGGYTSVDTEMKGPPQPGSGPAQPQQTQPWDRMVVRTANLQLKVKDVGVSLDEVRGVAGTHGGYVTQTDSHQEGEHTVATITIQVPSREFDGVVSKLRKIGVKPLQENISSSDVTEEYTDLQSQLRNLQATEQRILALMGKAERIEDVLTLDRELRQVRGEVERVQGRLNYLGKRAEMSTITVSLHPEAAPIEIAKSGDVWDPAQVALSAWNASLDLLAGVGKVVISAAVFLWWAVPVLLAFWLIMRPKKRTITSNAPNGESS